MEAINSVKYCHKFAPPLKTAKIIKRHNRFIVEVEMDESSFLCHCPATGTIGNLPLAGLPCLISSQHGEQRKTAYTLEGIYVHSIKSWVGINQNAINRYIECLLQNNDLPELIAKPQRIIREYKIGNARIDFKVDEDYLEVKMPLRFLPGISNLVANKISSPTEAFYQRFLKHLNTLTTQLEQGHKANLLACFLYDAPYFLDEQPRNGSTIVSNEVAKAIASGLRIWQVNLRLLPETVSLIRYFDVSELSVGKQEVKLTQHQPTIVDHPIIGSV